MHLALRTYKSEGTDRQESKFDILLFGLCWTSTFYRIEKIIIHCLDRCIKVGSFSGKYRGKSPKNGIFLCSQMPNSLSESHFWLSFMGYTVGSGCSILREVTDLELYFDYRNILRLDRSIPTSILLTGVKSQIRFLHKLHVWCKLGCMCFLSRVDVSIF